MRFLLCVLKSMLVLGLCEGKGREVRRELSRRGNGGSYVRPDSGLVLLLLLIVDNRNMRNSESSESARLYVTEATGSSPGLIFLESRWKQCRYRRQAHSSERLASLVKHKRQRLPRAC